MEEKKNIVSTSIFHLQMHAGLAVMPLVTLS